MAFYLKNLSSVSRQPVPETVKNCNYFNVGSPELQIHRTIYIKGLLLYMISYLDQGLLLMNASRYFQTSIVFSVLSMPRKLVNNMLIL